MNKPTHYKGRLNRRGRKIHKMVMRRFCHAMAHFNMTPSRKWFSILSHPDAKPIEVAHG